MAGRRSTPAVLSLLGALILAAPAALAGCSDGDSWDDDIAAYVGETEITEAQVDQVVGDLGGELRAELEQELDQRTADGELDQQSRAAEERQRLGELEERVATAHNRVLEMRILTEAGIQYAAEVGLEVPAQPSDRAIDRQAEELELDPGNSYIRVVAHFLGVLTALQNTVEPVAPTEADQRELYDNLVAEGLTSSTFREAQAVLTEEVMGEPVAMRNLLVAAVGRAEVRVNPEYDLAYRVPVPLGEQESWLSVPLGEAG